MLNISAPINDTSYGYTSINFLNQFTIQGVDFALDPIGPCKETIETSKTFFKNGNSLRLFHQYDIHPRIGTGKHFGFPIFELDNFSPKEIRSIQACDEIIVCSKWAKDVMSKFFRGPIHVCPLGVDTSIFYPKDNNSLKTIFLNIGKWEIRKGHDVLIKCFNKAFLKNDNVELWMVPANRFLSHEEEKYWLSLYNAPNVRILPRLKTQNELSTIINKSDIGIFPSRAEGWNLGLLEMLACGKRVICTNYSGHTEFTSKEFASMIEISDLESAYDGKWFFNQGNWAKIGEKEEEQIIEAMRHEHRLKKDGALGVNILGVEKAKSLDWIHSSNKLYDIIKCQS